MGIFTEVYESNQNIVNNIGQDKYKVGGNQLAKAWDDAQKLVDDANKRRHDNLVALYGR